MTHTKGPWRVGKDRETVTEPNTDDIIAKPGKNFSIINPSQRLEANARLIAAAPELLEALKMALTSLDDLSKAYPEDATFDNGNDGYAFTATEQARTAITKATQG